MNDSNDLGRPIGPPVALSVWLAQIGVTACTAWRWRKKGWLDTINICGRQYVTQEAIAKFNARAERGEFAQPPKVPAHSDEPEVPWQQN